MSKNLLALALAMAVGGCSWGARSVRSVTSSECSTSRAAPLVDAGIAAAGAAAFAYEFSKGLAGETGDQRSGLMGAGFLVGAAFASSAVSGFAWAADCRRGSVPTTAARW